MTEDRTMPKSLSPIEKFMRDFGPFFKAPRLNIHSEIRVRLQVMLDEAENRGIRIGREQLRVESSAPLSGSPKTRGRLAAMLFAATLDDEDPK
jgi:hypothetical protein